MDGSFSIGTVKKGLIKLDENGNLIETLNKKILSSIIQFYLFTKMMITIYG